MGFYLGCCVLGEAQVQFVSHSHPPFAAPVIWSAASEGSSGVWSCVYILTSC